MREGAAATRGPWETTSIRVAGLLLNENIVHRAVDSIALCGGFASIHSEVVVVGVLGDLRGSPALCAKAIRQIVEPLRVRAKVGLPAYPATRPHLHGAVGAYGELGVV